MTLPLEDRALLAFTQLVIRDEQRRIDSNYGATDSDVLDMIECWTVESCPEWRACDSDECCDYQRLGVLVWSMVEGRCRDAEQVSAVLGNSCQSRRP